MSSRKRFLAPLSLGVVGIFLLSGLHDQHGVVRPGPASETEVLLLQPLATSTGKESPAAAATGKLFSGDRTRSFPAEERMFSPARSLLPPPPDLLSKRRHCRKWGVFTTVFPPSEAVRRFLRRSDWCLVVVADRDHPVHYALPDVGGDDRVVFLSAEDQVVMNSEFVDALPWRSFGRKNVGYLYAVARGAEVIWDFDDDNMLKFWLEGASPDPWLDLDWVVGSVLDAESIRVVTAHRDQPKERMTRAFNPYPVLGCPTNPCWPRGFPLDAVTREANVSLLAEEIPTRTVGVLQSLADHEPDVDAIYRMTQGTPMYFNRSGNDSLPVVLSPDLVSPLNAQATLHFRPAFFALYLPVTVAGRVSDIWRSYVAQAIFSLLDLRVGFLPRPLVTQERNQHSTRADFESEIPLYTQTTALLEFLSVWSVEVAGIMRTEEAIEDLWVGLYERCFVDLDDVFGVQRWLQALNSVGYVLPSNENSQVRTLLQRSVKTHQINLNVGKSMAENPMSGMPTNCQEMTEKKRFWISDLHDGTLRDLPSQLATLGQKVVLGGTKGGKYQLSANGMFSYRPLSEALQGYISHSSTLSADMVEENFKFYRSDSAVQNTDAFVCSFPASMCELWAPFNKSVVFLPAHRYNLGRCNKSEFTGLNEWLLELSKDGRNVIGAMSRYDLEYLKYYLDLPEAKLMSSLSGFYTNGSVYDPSRKEVLIVSNDNVPDHFKDIIDVVSNATNAVPLRQLYTRYEFTDLVQHPAIVLLPYSVMSYKLTEFYSLGIPLFVPSPTYFLRHGGLGSDRTASSPPYCPRKARLNDNMLKQPKSAHPYSPNVDFQGDPEAEMFWLQFADFYDWLYITTFDDVGDLVSKLATTDLKRVHVGMMKSYAARSYRTLEQWCEVIPHLHASQSDV